LKVLEELSAGAGRSKCGGDIFESGKGSKTGLGILVPEVVKEV
jgi:hypothetical protein